MRSTGRPLDDGVTSAGWTVVAAMLLTGRVVMSRGGGGFEVLGLVAASRTAAQKVRAAAVGAAQKVRAPAAAAATSATAPLQLLQLRAVVLRGARHRFIS